jgi:hypothetical protein
MLVAWQRCSSTVLYTDTPALPVPIDCMQQALHPSHTFSSKFMFKNVKDTADFGDLRKFEPFVDYLKGPSHRREALEGVLEVGFDKCDS